MGEAVTEGVALPAMRLPEGGARPEGGREAHALGGGAGAARAVGPGGQGGRRLRHEAPGASA